MVNPTHQEIACIHCEKVPQTVYYVEGSSYCVRCFRIKVKDYPILIGGSEGGTTVMDKNNHEKNRT